MIRDDLGGLFLAVISHARPANVPAMHALVGDATWFVGAGEGHAYRDAGAVVAVESGPLCRSRNAALETAGGRACVQVSDDLRRVQIAVDNGEKLIAVDVPFDRVVAMVTDAIKRTGARLGGAAPTSNPFYANVANPIHRRAFIVGDFILVAANCALRFDEQMTLKEDYDYTLQHLKAFGMVARRDDVLMSFAHRTNAGGAVEARTSEVEQQNIAYLKAKWPGFIKNNPRRKDEILLHLPSGQRGR